MKYKYSYFRIVCSYWRLFHFLQPFLGPSLGTSIIQTSVPLGLEDPSIRTGMQVLGTRRLGTRVLQHAHILIPKAIPINFSQTKPAKPIHLQAPFIIYYR